MLHLFLCLPLSDSVFKLNLLTFIHIESILVSVSWNVVFLYMAETLGEGDDGHQPPPPSVSGLFAVNPAEDQLLHCFHVLSHRLGQSRWSLRVWSWNNDIMSRNGCVAGFGTQTHQIFLANMISNTYFVADVNSDYHCLSF